MGNTFSRYQQLAKPSWAPPAWIFGPVWSVLYVIIALTFGTVFYTTFTGSIPQLVALPFALNLIFNLAFTPLQFTLKNNYLAALDIVLLLATLVWSIIVIDPRIPWIAYALIPYLLWVCFATVLQLTITVMNIK
jgi:tryptophan-rich sensory protein